MAISLVTFLCSLTITLLIIKYQSFFNHIIGDTNYSGPQKFHNLTVPRIGGLAILISLLISGFLSVLLKKNGATTLLAILVCGAPSFLIGFTEDVTKRVSVKIRLLTCLLSAILAWHLLNASVTRTDFFILDALLQYPTLSLLFTCIAITGLANSYNIIDGFNGLASMVAILSALAIGYVSFQVADFEITILSLTVASSIAGFFIWNYPRGLIFLGDGGAYLIGYLIAVLTILLVNRHNNISAWFAVLINAYPIFETLFTIWRRKILKGKSPAIPDGAHLHTLIFKRIVRWATTEHTKLPTNLATLNARTSPYIWFMSTLAIVPALIWWENTIFLQIFCLIFCITYIVGYRTLVKFKTPKWFKC